ncbi:MAG: formylglycine-generating enzyme family protein [bacterium]|nr:formylglycine-generating enzyme family protein [bacterium]
MARKKASKLRNQHRPGLALFIAPAIFCLGVVTCLANGQSGQGGVTEPPVSFEVPEEESLVIDPERSGAKTGLLLEIFGLRDDEEFQCFVDELRVECKITGQKDDRPAHVQLEFSHDVPPGKHSIHLVQGKHVHTRWSAIYIAHRPRLNGTPCDDHDAVLELLVGQPLDLSVAPHSGSNLKILLAGEELQAELKETGRVIVQVPNEIPQEARLKLVEEAGAFGRIPLCERRVRVLGDTFRLDGVTFTYDPAQQRVRARLRGTGLPDVVTARLAGADRPITFQATGNEGQARVYSSEPVVQRFDRFLSFELSSDNGVIHQTRGRWLARKPDLWSFKELESKLEFDLDEIFEEQGSGEVELGGKVFSFGRIDARQVYAIGLSEERSRDPRLAQFNLAAPSSHPSGIISLELRDGFLMSVYEVTNSQFLAYARQSGLPSAQVPETLRLHLEKELAPELTRLPVTGLSFVDVQGYVAWLQARLAGKTSKWQVRLPHELEWEMAARGTRPWDYAFKDHDRENGLPTLERAGPRPVGANPMDHSPFGIRDMTGNVREWTNTVYNEQMLEYLAVYMTNSLADGWEPTRLAALPGVFEELPRDLSRTSRKMTVRGGANGESPVRLLVSLRRQMEIAEAAEDVGFRLVLVPRKGH